MKSERTKKKVHESHEAEEEWKEKTMKTKRKRKKATKLIRLEALSSSFMRKSFGWPACANQSHWKSTDREGTNGRQRKDEFELPGSYFLFRFYWNTDMDYRFFVALISATFASFDLFFHSLARFLSEFSFSLLSLLYLCVHNESLRFYVVLWWANLDSRITRTSFSQNSSYLSHLHHCAFSTPDWYPSTTKWYEARLLTNAQWQHT